MKVNIPKYGTINIENVILDINGTIQFEGKIQEALVPKMKELKEHYNVFLVSSDTRGNLKELAGKLEVDYIRIKDQEGPDVEAKNKELLKLGKHKTVTIGNGNNDFMMLQNAVLGLVIIGSEGASTKAIINADVAFPDPISAINFLLDKKIMIATLRK